MSKIRPRCQDRERVLRDVTFRVLPGGFAWRGSTIDMSPSGAQIFSEQSLHPGDLIEVSWAGGGTPLRLMGRVANVRVQVEGTWAGVQFIHPLDPTVFETLCERSGRAVSGPNGRRP